MYLGSFSPQKKERSSTMQELKSSLLTNKYTRIFHEDSALFKFNAPHHFLILESDLAYSENTPCKILTRVDFQEGPIKENGVNGVANEDLINMIICRLEHFQQTEFACRENDLAITKLEEALMWLRKRTNDREMRKVEGTNEV